ncbi:hypothetical protein Chor_009271 [Crotalus horridus]
MYLLYYGSFWLFELESCQKLRYHSVSCKNYYALCSPENEEEYVNHVYLCLSRSFFQPLARIKSEKEKAEDSHMEDVLISQKKLINGSEFGEDFPVNSASKKVAKVLKSDDKEDSVELVGKDAQADDNKLVSQFL